MSFEEGELLWDRFNAEMNEADRKRRSDEKKGKRAPKKMKKDCEKGIYNNFPISIPYLFAFMFRF